MPARSLFLTALAVLALALAIGSLSRGFAAGSDTFDQKIRDLLEKAWGERPAELPIAQDLFEAAQDLQPDDPRASHAYGLVLWKHHRYSDAQNQFETAVKQGTSPYLPAWHLLIHLRVLRGDHDEALADLAAWVRAVVGLKPDSPEGKLKDDYIAWTGRVVGYLEKPASSKRINAQAKELDAEIVALLSTEQQELYSSKKAEVLGQYDQITALRDQTRAEAKKQEEKKKQERKAEIAKKRSQLADEQDKLEMSAEEWETWIDRQLTNFDGQLGRYESDYARLVLAAQSITRSMAERNRDLFELRARQDQALRDERPSTTPSAKSPDMRPPAPKAPESKPTQPKPGEPKAKDKAKPEEKPKNTPASSNPEKAKGSIESRPPATTREVATTRNDNRRSAALYQGSIDRLTRELEILRREYAALDQDAADVKAAVRRVLVQRQAAIARYEKATGQLVKKSDALRVWEGRLAGEAKAASEPATGKSAGDRAMGTTASSLTTYVPSNLDSEKQRLLDSLAP
ncbi:MAG: hypothetical protein HY000_25205 [Planctomycetes bacterium]|nr:hypothetical protein [Planctomycetota bacterium]